MYKVKFYKPVLIDQPVLINITDRGLNDDCYDGDKHHRLLLPKEEGQKEYCICMKCFEHSHL